LRPSHNAEGLMSGAIAGRAPGRFGPGAAAVVANAPIANHIPRDSHVTALMLRVLPSGSDAVRRRPARLTRSATPKYRNNSDVYRNKYCGTQIKIGLEFMEVTKPIDLEARLRRFSNPGSILARIKAKNNLYKRLFACSGKIFAILGSRFMNIDPMTAVPGADRADTACVRSARGA